MTMKEPLSLTAEMEGYKEDMNNLGTKNAGELNSTNGDPTPKN